MRDAHARLRGHPEGGGRRFRSDGWPVAQACAQEGAGQASARFRRPPSLLRRSPASSASTTPADSWSAGGTEALKNTEGAAGLNIRVTTAYGDITARSL
ncbi:hypothetical protein FNV62_03435 [Streptomyces sp. RLB3-17]|nr:hypothetical protein FNV62_03435 [Streptomyces sp. RLB3-17]